ncbi:phosphatase PAP2 family protein [Streptomyces sp. NBC_01207]|uniref:phosphatase PAP2 family protein n=1 Tax=Streptomyces sp. NBC_01207 TaxID=2903772 RepID=UPI002E1605AF|nr:phosphatase PAP2 family protein [Streptomyces sp. NBC_01207]
MTMRSGTEARRSRFLWLVPVQAAVMVALGLFVTAVPAGHRLLATEDGITGAFAARRTPWAGAVSEWVSVVASTEGIVGVTLIGVISLLLLPRTPRWADALFLGASVAVQSAVFLVVTMCVDRPRPDVPHLDGAPPTSSFPSGHVGASMALYGALATLVWTRVRGPWRYVAAAVLVLVPPVVGLSRMYRGMHHPSDVAGGLVNGLATLLVMHSVFLSCRTRTRIHTRTRAHDTAGGPDAVLPALPVPGARGGVGRCGPADEPAEERCGQRAVVVRHPHGCGDDLAERVRLGLDRNGYTDQRWTSTSLEQPCGTLPEECAEPGVGLVVVCGGDGTVRACADVVAGTGTPLALVPCGTGNLLARNLDLPLDPLAALETALGGGVFPIDVGRVWGDGLPPTRFTVMTGAGFDAATVRDTSPALKARLGWAAYVLSAVRHLGDPGMRLVVRVDGGRARRRRARMVVVGNVGALQGGLELLPRARPDSGRLEVVLFDPRGAAGWLAAAGHLASRLVRTGARAPDASAQLPTGRRTVAGGALEYISARRIEIRFADVQAREVDGDAMAEGSRLFAEVEPGTLQIFLPGAPGSTPSHPHEHERTHTGTHTHDTENAHSAAHAHVSRTPHPAPLNPSRRAARRTTHSQEADGNREPSATET